MGEKIEKNALLKILNEFEIEKKHHSEFALAIKMIKRIVEDMAEKEKNQDKKEECMWCGLDNIIIDCTYGKIVEREKIKYCWYCGRRDE